MDDFFIPIALLFILLLMVCAFVLPITALVISIRSSQKLKHLPGVGVGQGNSQQQAQLKDLEARIQRLEQMFSSEPTLPPKFVEPTPAGEPPPPVIVSPTPTPEPARGTVQPLTAVDVESIIGRRWIGWAAIVLILFGTAFFLKYAFDNRWIGEVGRVAIGITFGVGMTVIGRKPGYVPGLHHFGIDVDDVEEAINRIRRRYPDIAVLKRPSNRPFATFGAHDPEGNYFDLTQEGMENRRDVYVEASREQPRRIHHIKLRVMNPAAIASFYRDLFDLKEEEKALEDPNFYLTDGKVTLIIAPWKMTDFEGAGIDRPGIEHIGYTVESVNTVKKELSELRESNPEMRERIVSEPKEAERRLALIATCRYGQHQFSDPDGVFIDISEA